ncbi:hypothetical protein XENOCAPTIV_009520, partial [Xenoophorus captivus]
GVNEEVVCKNHLILGQHLYKALEGRDLNLYGGEKLRVKVNKKLVLIGLLTLEENGPGGSCLDI